MKSKAALSRKAENETGLDRNFKVWAEASSAIQLVNFNIWHTLMNDLQNIPWFSIFLKQLIK